MGANEFMKRMEVSNRRFVTQIQEEVSGSSTQQEGYKLKADEHIGFTCPEGTILFGERPSPKAFPLKCQFNVKTGKDNGRMVGTISLSNYTKKSTQHNSIKRHISSHATLLVTEFRLKLESRAVFIAFSRPSELVGQWGTHSGSGTFRGQLRASDALKLELQAIVSFETWALENKLFFCKGRSHLSTPHFPFLPC